MSDTAPTSWTAAWNDARPRIQEIQQELANSVSPSPRVLRVGQLDAELLDAELVQLLREPISKALTLVNVCTKSNYIPNVSYD
jgi:peroxin-2